MYCTYCTVPLCNDDECRLRTVRQRFYQTQQHANCMLRTSPSHEIVLIFFVLSLVLLLNPGAKFAKLVCTF